jgi:hypothetical protein
VSRFRSSSGTGRSPRRLSASLWRARYLAALTFGAIWFAILFLLARRWLVQGDAVALVLAGGVALSLLTVTLLPVGGAHTATRGRDGLADALRTVLGEPVPINSDDCGPHASALDSFLLWVKGLRAEEWVDVRMAVDGVGRALWFVTWTEIMHTRALSRIETLSRSSHGERWVRSATRRLGETLGDSNVLNDLVTIRATYAAALSIVFRHELSRRHASALLQPFRRLASASGAPWNSRP